MTTQVWLARASATPHRAQQWWVLTLRMITPAVQSGEVLTSILAPAAFTASFYIPLKTIMTFTGTGFSSYAQFMMPLVILQAAAFTAVSAAFRAATDAVAGLNRRFGSMPIGALVPAGARLCGNVFRLVIALAAALICGHIIGFRFYLGTTRTIEFLLFSILIGMALILAADVIGTVSRSPETTAQALVLPPLIFGMLSTGLAPASQFPSWVQPFVRNQPVSQWASALRALAGDRWPHGDPNLSLMTPPLVWTIAILVVCLGFSIRLGKGRR
ncbi:ABC transporter permease [Nocardia macrotermitis]|uniref:Doxorubicin resistance ABC transporter permease protein DrrB n=1 Tax=Nocardia macrotermitis TaxID=2585198 RepID=A0A7K0D456_9NOCA|nr:ABC transporter permease [Nocardia macrotermitis]MQY20477.1 Doxorubicin resistance ABC transporter permease protein DrrB [Nocardia macrotermitis]